MIKLEGDFALGIIVPAIVKLIEYTDNNLKRVRT